MIYPRDCEIWRACSKKNGKHPNVTLRQTAIGPRLEATDGRIAVSIHVMDHPTNWEGPIEIDPDAFKEAKKRTRNGDQGELIMDADRGDIVVPGGPAYHCKEANTGCPSMDWVDPVPETRIGLNAKLLLELAKSMGGEQVWLEIMGDKILVKVIGDNAEIVGGRYGYIFPVHPR